MGLQGYVFSPDIKLVTIPCGDVFVKKKMRNSQLLAE
jgi:hypothetical protein